MVKVSKNIRTNSPAEEAAAIAASEARSISLYGSRIVPGTTRRDPTSTKMLVTVRTMGLDGKMDGGTREVRTSDIFQCLHQEGVKKSLKTKKSDDKAKAPKAVKVKAPAKAKTKAKAKPRKVAAVA